MVKKKIVKKPVKKPSKKPGPKTGEGGRPVKLEIDETVLRQVEDMAGLGLTQKEIALILDISARTFRDYKTKEKELSAAYQRGRAVGAHLAAGKVRTLIKQGDKTMLIFYLKTQCGWRETEIHEHTGKDGGPIESAQVVFTYNDNGRGPVPKK